MDNSIIGSMLVLLTIIALMVRGLWQASRERSYKVSRDGKRITLSRRALEAVKGDIETKIKEYKECFGINELMDDMCYRGSLNVINEILSLFEEDDK